MRVGPVFALLVLIATLSSGKVGAGGIGSMRQEIMKGYWSLTVTGNWRIVFRYHEPTYTANDSDVIDDH